MTAPPALVVAAPASGCGKTTVATGLIGALRRSGHRVAPFKVGPDFIDPGYHRLAGGRPGRNLDPVLVGEEMIGPLYRHGAAGADLAVVEGVMGLFDGRIEPGRPGPAAGSTAQVAGLLGAPVVLVVDARGQSQSLAALLHGFTTFDPATRLAGVILNRVGSARHEQVLRAACEQAGVPVWGAIPRATQLRVPSRHLGLITAAEHGRAADAAVAAMTDLVCHHVDVAGLAARAALRVGAPAWDPAAVIGTPVARPVTVALAAGTAFSFGYPEHRELLAAAGADIATFDPLVDPLPPGAAALVVPGGFPEEHAAGLTANTVLRRQVAALAARAPVHAECAGLTYLAADLDGAPMCGVLNASARFTDTLTLGYREAVAATDSVSHHAGERVVGHEFHRTTITFADTPNPAWMYRDGGGAVVHDGAAGERLHAAYLHTHPAAHPQAVARFVAHADRLSR
ncbi:cobyrinate a,c-diamide synthase [Mycolicibacillus parakoreensis]|uniref:Hydrogenobyrinate a,c-diamide synthase n=1 Tax=Mycolicibacillus parakoreensis TaxID=1069221 RepID=A0ABY3TZ92_9MYCO|nr:cobyrinate a,c-diamide synthase [Mycolicibacillus parakoreensis]MCV7317297.1 cobyrinate a,c-diamide synthase [Mycolicibacillus parakoreensis]ULN51660.1 cobyrinate a,c-diamide synthase [Mycolicibacillus parakoreensis]HLS00227.1 cobyrinate a,c-diamide synthase [Mycolicibacillus parakoreensis]